MPRRYFIKFPYSALHFDFDHAGQGKAWVIDREGHSAKMIIEVKYPFTDDPTIHNCIVTSARLIKGWSGFDLNPRVVRLVQPKPKKESQTNDF